MKKHLEDQRGLAPAVIVIIIAVLVALGVVIYLVSTNDDSESAESTEGTADTADESIIGDNKFSGSYLDAIDRGRPLRCTWRAPEGTVGDNQAKEGVFYTDGVSRGYSEGSFVVADEETKAYAIFNREYVYNWFAVAGGQKTGTRIPAASLREQRDRMTDQQRQQALSEHAQYKFDCRGWTVNEKILTPPRDVKFTDISS